MGDTLQIFLVFILPWLGLPLAFLGAYYRLRYRELKRTRRLAKIQLAKEELTAHNQLAQLSTHQDVRQQVPFALEWYNEQFNCPGTIE